MVVGGEDSTQSLVEQRALLHCILGTGTEFQQPFLHSVGERRGRQRHRVELDLAEELGQNNLCRSLDILEAEVLDHFNDGLVELATVQAHRQSLQSVGPHFESPVVLFA